MKRMLTILLVLVTFKASFESTVLSNSKETSQTFFWGAYSHVRKWEGNYSYLPYDKGGETYAGITRNFNKHWEGWTILDQHKKDSSVYWNKKIFDLEDLVTDYYYNVWIRDNFHLIEDSTVAIYVFDYRNTGIISYRHVQRVLQNHGYDIKSTGKMDLETIEAINKIDPVVFISNLRKLRKSFYLQVVDRNPNMKRYLQGWLNRTNDIWI